ncbi:MULTISPECIES: phage holin [Lysinibacillus]|uniref:Phage holin n=1 Tax=Lysinibacillus antri TaxID=2498145 RepID=A0A432LGC6_9BACI|nr:MULTISPECIES: phage holin [Lysinibacillus]RUL56917.1 phage holin [Lysinibacillus antri]TSI08594.1 phage holin [Lysinibacillus sp. BW-2-10]
MKINWKVRLRHRQFWIALVSALALLANQVAAIFGVDVTIISSQIQQTLETVLMILALLGVIIDPTTSGMKDSNQALTYKKPRKE